MRYVILIHSNPDPWGHPAERYTPEGRALPEEALAEMDRHSEALMEELSASGEFVLGEALAAPSSAAFYGWTPDGHVPTDGPYAEAKEHLAGFFLIDCADRSRAEQIAAQFSGPGSIVELRPAMSSGADDR